jgi:hypothetical protein
VESLPFVPSPPPPPPTAPAQSLPGKSVVAVVDIGRAAGIARAWGAPKSPADVFPGLPWHHWTHVVPYISVGSVVSGVTIAAFKGFKRCVGWVAPVCVGSPAGPARVCLWACVWSARYPKVTTVVAVPVYAAMASLAYAVTYRPESTYVWQCSVVWFCGQLGWRARGWRGGGLGACLCWRLPCSVGN